MRTTFLERGPDTIMEEEVSCLMFANRLCAKTMVAVVIENGHLLRLNQL